MPYASKIRRGALNVQGFAETLKLKNTVQIMQEHRLDVMILTETKSTSYYSYQSEGYLVVLSGNHKDKHAGVGVVLSPTVRPYLLDVNQVSNRIIHLAFKKKGGNIHIIGAYGPHSGRDFEMDRQPFWESLEELVHKIPQPEPVYVTGDFNVRFQAGHKNDEGVLGPFVYGKGPRFIDHTAESNRHLCVNFFKSMGMVEAASYLTPNMVHQITYRDKTAPPTSWAQFVLDPLILQQFYGKVFELDSEESLPICSIIRAFLTDEAPLPPERKDPHPDPIRFQRLDHTFTRQQWLSSVNSCRSKLHAGFPSDHYPLITEVQVKLAKRTKGPPAVRRFNFKNINIHQRFRFNNALKTELGIQDPEGYVPDLTDHTAKGVFYTDGSGSKGRCNASTPAGWGWCMLSGSDWIDARGPVITHADHTAYLGATVGSNNTGELSAIAEAVLYAIEHEIRHVVIHSDSQWSINVLTGRWRPKTHHNFINNIRQLLKTPGFDIRFQWIKAHVGYEGNERADKLAEEGKAIAEATGGRRHARPQQHQPEITHHTAENFTKAVNVALKATFDYEHAPRPWITQETLEALRMARIAEAESREDARPLRNKAKRLAKRDRIRHVHSNLTEDPSGITKKTWTTARQQKRGFVGRKSHLVVDGKPVPWSQTHEAFRDHLQNEQWASRLTTPPVVNEEREALHPQDSDEPPFILVELQRAIAKLKKNKAPGPDGVPNEVFQLLDADGEIALLNLYNDTLRTQDVPSSWTEARVVSIYKGKGSDTDVNNYRPISLLNTTYKLFATMMQARMAQHSDHKLRATQYGFRAGKGTRHPLFILRRAMEWAKMTNKPLHLLFLDWRQAFDSIDHTAMIGALKRFGVPNNFLGLIRQFYTAPTFQVDSWLGHSAKGSVNAGIRQGCPLVRTFS